MAELTKILYAEDEPDIQVIVRMALADLGGFTLFICNNGQEVIDNAEIFSPDLVLLDVMMPGLDGPTALSELRKKEPFKHTPVIFMTAKAQNHEIKQYIELGAADIIIKPFDPMTLAVTVKEIFDRAQAIE